MALTISTAAFNPEGKIPPKFTCDGENVSPTISWSGVPENAKSLVLIMDDPDVPKEVLPEQMYDHWVLFNIPPTTPGLPEGGEAGIGGNNTAGAWTYTGPCPPPQYEPNTHRYFFKLYALDIMLDLTRGATKRQVEELMEGHILEQTQMMGTYSRKH